GLDDPARGGVVPARLRDLRLEAGVLVEVEVLADPLGMLEDLGREGVLFLRYVPRLFQERQIDVGLDVALGAGIAVPVPGSTEIPCLLDDAGIGDTHLLESRRGQQPPEAAADDDGVELLSDGGSREARLDVGVRFEVRVLAADFQILSVPVRAQTPLALGGIFRAQRDWIEAQLLGSWNSARFGLLYSFAHRDSTPVRFGRCLGVRYFL